jgi:hypothetical protein
MRRLIVLFIGLFITGSSFAQNNIGIGTTNPNSNAILDLYNGGQPLGLILPRVDINDFSLGANDYGLCVYDTIQQSVLFWTGTEWTELAPGWLLGGNSGTNPANDFIGTTDAQDLNFRTNNLQRLNISGATGYLGINAAANALSHAYVFRSAVAGSGDFGPGRSNIHAYRDGGSVATEGGAGWSYGTADVALMGTSFWGNNFTAGVAGYNFNDYVNSTAVLGAQYNASYWGALAHNDASGVPWGVYTPNNAFTGGNQTVNGSVLVGGTGVLSFGGVAVLNQIGSPNDIYANIRVLRNSSTTLQDGMYIGYGNTGGTAADLRFYANGTTQRMYIDAANGNVGIGTATALYKLSIGGAVGAIAVDNQATLLARNSGGGYETFMWPRWSDNVMYINYGTGGFNIRNNGSATTMFMTNAGSVGIGTSAPGARLHVEGGSIINGYNNFNTSLDATAGNMSIGQQTAIGNVKLNVNSNVLFSIYSTATTGNYAIYTLGIAAGNIDWAVASDRRFKKDIVPISNAVDLVKNLEGVRYNYDREAFPDKKFPTKSQVGLIAQDVNQILPEVVNIDNEGYYSIGYGSIVPVLIQAIKEQQARIEVLEEKLKDK